MQHQEPASDPEFPAVHISTAHQFREAISRLRFLEGAAMRSSLGRERIALELAISSYLASGQQDKSR